MRMIMVMKIFSARRSGGCCTAHTASHGTVCLSLILATTIRATATFQRELLH